MQKGLKVADFANRVLPAARIEGLVHQTIVSHGKIVTVCRLPVKREELMVFLQRRQDIACPDCQVGGQYNYYSSGKTR